MRLIMLGTALGVIPTTVVAQMAGGDGDISTLLTISNFGVLGIVAYLYFTQNRQQLAKLNMEKDEAHQEIRGLNKEIREQVLPALIRCTEVLARIETASNKPQIKR